MQWNNKGSSLNHLGRHEEAIACYDAALQLYPLSVSWFNKGVSLFAMKKVEEALVCYAKAIELNPKLERAWSNRGVALKSMGKTQEALQCYDRAIEANPVCECVDWLQSRGRSTGELPASYPCSSAPPRGWTRLAPVWD